MRQVFLLLLFMTVLQGCDRHIVRTIRLDALQESGTERPLPYAEIEQIARANGFIYVLPPVELLNREKASGREILAWYDTTPSSISERGAWNYFWILKDLKSGKIILEFHQFPDLVEQSPIRIVREQVEGILRERKIHFTLESGR